MNRISRKLFIASTMTLGLVAPASAVPLYNTNLKFAPGDLVVTFQKIGSENTIYANLGQAATLYRGTAAGPDAANRLNIIDLSSTLTAAYGPGWASDTGIYAGVVGVYSTAADSDVLDGDPSRTLYVSKARTAIGTVGAASSAAWNLRTAGDTAMSSAAGNIYASNNVLETREADSYTTIALTEDSQIDDQNPFLSGTIQGTAYGVFSGGVQQAGSATSFGTFGEAGTAEFALDLYRILAMTGLDGQVAGATGALLARQGTYEGTITVATNGMVSFIAQGTTNTPFQSWALTYPALDTAAKRLPTADNDNDGMTNLMEFVLNGNPGVANSAAIAPTLNASGSNFVFSFNRRDDSETGNTLVFQYGSNLVGWTDVTIGATGGVVGNATLVVNENTTSPDAITVTVPKSVAPGGSLFGRLKVSQ